MYRSFFQLRQDPFDNFPDPQFFYNSPEHEEAVASLQHVIMQRKGAILLTGTSGVGKTLVARLALRDLTGEVRSAWVRNSLLSTNELLVEIGRGLQIDVDVEAAHVDLMSALERYLIRQFRNDRLVVIVVDETQDFPPDAFRLFKTLNNLEVDDAKLVQLILLGQPSAEERLASQACEGFRDRIYRVFNLGPLDPDQTTAYLLHRLRLAGEDCNVCFTTEAVRAIHRISTGVPRSINKVAEFSLLAAYAGSSHVIDENIVLQAIEGNHLTAEKLLEPPEDAETGRELEPRPEPSPAPTSPPRGLPHELRHIRMITRGVRIRKDRLEEAVRLADSTLDRIHDATMGSHEQLSRLQSLLDQLRTMTEEGRTVGDTLKNERNRAEKEARERVASVSAQVDDLLKKLQHRVLEADRVHQRTQHDAADTRDLMVLLEQGNQHTAGLAARLEELHGRARGLAENYRALQARLDASQDRVEQVLTASEEHLARLGQTEEILGKRLDSAGSAIAGLAKVGSVEQRLNETLKTARGTQTGLAEVHQRVLHTLEESEDHFADLTQALDQGRQYLEQTESLLNEVRADRESTLGARKDVRALLEAVTQQKIELNRSLEQISVRVDSVHKANQHAEQLLHSSQEALAELNEACQRAVDSMHQAVDRVEGRLANVHEQLEQAASAAQECLANVREQLDETADQTLERVDLHLAESRRHVSDAIAEAARDAESRVASAQEQFNEVAADAEQRLTHVQEQLSEAANQTVGDAERRVADARRQLTDTISEAVRDTETRLAEARQQVAKSTDESTTEAERRLGGVREQLDSAAAAAEACAANVREQAGQAANQAVSHVESRLADARRLIGDAVSESVREAESQLAAARRQTAESADLAVSEAEEKCAHVQEQLGQAASQAETRLAGIRKELGETAEQTVTDAEHRLLEARLQTGQTIVQAVHETESKLGDARQQLADVLSLADDRLVNLDRANTAAVQNTETTRRLLRQLDDANERSLTQQRDARRLHDELRSETQRADELLRQLGERLPECEDVRRRVEDMLLRANLKIDQLQASFETGDEFIRKAARFLDQLRSWKQDLVHDRTQAAKVLRRARRHLAAVTEAESRTRYVIQTAEDKTARLESTLERADRLLIDTGHKLTRMLQAHAKAEKLIAGGFAQLDKHQKRAEAIVLTLEKKTADVRPALEQLQQSVREAQQISKTQTRVGAGFQKQTKRIVARLYAQKLNAEKATESLLQATLEAEQAVAQPRAVLDEAMQRVPQLQKLCKLLHEIYFKLNTHIPEMITPHEWENMTDTAEGATRRLLIANTARIRQLAEVARRLFDKTSERLVHLQTENERATTLCGMLPQRLGRSIAQVGESGPIGRLGTALEQIHKASAATDDTAAEGISQPETASSRAPAQVHAAPSDPSIAATLAGRIAGLAEVVEEAKKTQGSKKPPVLPQRTPREHPLASTVMKQ